MNKEAIAYFREQIEKELRDPLGNPERLKALQDYLCVLEAEERRNDVQKRGISDM